MTGFSLQTWVQLLGGVRMAFGHTYLLGVFNVLQVLGDACRFASMTGSGSGLVVGRFAAGFCRAIAGNMMLGVGDRTTHWL